jgi:hypothetical protein
VIDLAKHARMTMDICEGMAAGVKAYDLWVPVKIVQARDREREAQVSRVYAIAVQLRAECVNLLPLYQVQGKSRTKSLRFIKEKAKELEQKLCVLREGGSV